MLAHSKDRSNGKASLKHALRSGLRAAIGTIKSEHLPNP
jgi:hypothetical protein